MTIDKSQYEQSHQPLVNYNTTDLYERPNWSVAPYVWQSDL